jgi:hypothetical protein
MANGTLQTNWYNQRVEEIRDAEFPMLKGTSL